MNANVVIMSRHWKKLFLITYWMRGREESEFNALTYFFDLLIIAGVLIVLIHGIMSIWTIASI